jgi:hypothetical protein
MSDLEKPPSGRVRRQPVGTRNRLSLHGKEPGYVYRIVADRSDSISQMISAGYEHVPADKIKVGDSRVNIPKAPGENASVPLGGGEIGYVMRTKEEFYNEDQARKRAIIQETKDTIKRVNKKDGNYGSIKLD